MNEKIEMAQVDSQVKLLPTDDIPSDYVKFNTMAMLLGNWFSDNDVHTMRLHLSHNDMDGYGCHLVTKYTNDCYYGKKGAKMRPIIMGNCGYDRNWQREVLENMVHRAFQMNYAIRHFSILITDLSNFDTTVIDEVMNLFGKLTYSYLIVDHHTIQSNTDWYVNASSVTRAFDEFDYWPKIHCSGFFTFPELDMSATRLIHRALMKNAPQLDSRREKFFRNRLEDIEPLVIAISDSDLGQWGYWTVPDKRDVSEAFQMRSSWNWYYKHKAFDKWIDDMIRYWTFNHYDDTELKELSDKQRERYYRDLTLVDLVNLIWENEWIITKQAYRKFSDLLDCSVVPVELTEFDRVYHEVYNYVVYIYPDADEKEELDDHILFFPMSKMYMEEHPEVDMVVSMRPSRSGDENKFDISLCSPEGETSPNCAEIARAFGGGGHVHAAGFTIDTH